MLEEVYQSILNFETALLNYKNNLTLENKRIYLLACADAAKVIKSAQDDIPAELNASWNRIVFIVNGIESTSKTFAKIREPEELAEYIRAQLIIIIGEIGASIKLINDIKNAAKELEIQENDALVTSTEEQIDQFDGEEVTANAENIELTDTVEEIAEIEETTESKETVESDEVEETKETIETEETADVEAVNDEMIDNVDEDIEETYETECIEENLEETESISEIKTELEETAEKVVQEPTWGYQAATSLTDEKLSQNPPKKKVVKKIIRRIVKKPVQEQQVPNGKKTVKKVIKRIIKKK